MTARNFSIIRPNLKDDGTFRSSDPNYQMINNTGVYRLCIMAWTEAGEEFSKVIYGSYDDLMKEYEANRNLYRTLQEIRILGNGTTDTIMVHYSVNVNAIVGDDFEFAEVA